jgi:hypothetical protein
MLQQSEFADISVVKPMGNQSRHLYTLKMFTAPFDTPTLPLFFSNNYHCVESLSDPVLVNPIGYCLEDLIPAKLLSQFLASLDHPTPDKGHMIVIGILHALLCLHHHNPDSNSIRKVCEACVMPDPARRPIKYGVASVADSQGLLRDGAIAYVKAFNGDTGKARAIQ